MLKGCKRNLGICIVVALLQLLLLPLSYADTTNSVYMIARSKITGTTYTQLVFFQSSELTTLDACEQERQYGLSSGWRIYTHFRKRGKITYSTLYSCAESKQQITNWIGQHSKRKLVYLVKVKQQQFSLHLMKDYAQCMHEVRKVQEQESKSLFCGNSSQKILSEG